MSKSIFRKAIIYIGFAIGIPLTVYGAIWLVGFMSHPTMMGEPVPLQTYLTGLFILLVGILITVLSYLSLKNKEIA